jgi:predicted small metal-binding protein
MSSIIMKKLSCGGSGLDCDFILKANTEEEESNNGKDHVFAKHLMKKKDVIPHFNEKLRPLTRNN